MIVECLEGMGEPAKVGGDLLEVRAGEAAPDLHRRLFGGTGRHACRRRSSRLSDTHDNPRGSGSIGEDAHHVAQAPPAPCAECLIWWGYA